MSQQAVPIDPHETLYLPMRRRFMSEYVQTEEGTTELRIYYGLKEISIEEPELHAFGENLLKQDSFMAGMATRWSTGEPLPWERVQELLAHLLSENILSREAPKLAAETDYHKMIMAAEAKRPAPDSPLWWNPDTEGVLKQLVGRPMEFGFLEAMLPVHRAAHAALDAEGRHIGENNVFPDSMRMRMETEWRMCPYPGSRFRDDALMNVTALKSMTKVWKPSLQAMLILRDEFLKRYPLLPDGQWRIGDLHAFSCAVLALPSMMLLRGENPVPNGTLDPLLSSVFRVTDGVRMVSIYLMFLPEQPMPYETPINPASLLHLTERDNHFLSTRGVCAGPPHMVEEFFATMLDGKPLAGEPLPEPSWLEEIPAAFDYGLRGLQLYSLQFTLWAHMCHTYEKLRDIILQAEAPKTTGWGRLRERLEKDWKTIQPTRQHTEVQRAWAKARYVEMYDRAQRGLRGFSEDKLQHISDVFAPAKDAVHEETVRQLRVLFRERAPAPEGANPELTDRLADVLADYITIERSAVGTLDNVQREVNKLLKREHPQRHFTNLDLSIHHRLRFATIGVLPYLMEVFREELGLTIQDDVASVTITPGNPRAVAA
ncbi:hypothetical protein SAMN05443572_110186 [Myxococcus fulvus]|uniref:Uncharacterized protein n=1 Tax=Myxococcus fulvus TaxID=33 RepID=A0A511T9R7_MYXFU|nr:hypothetical protein [Myxococcus fulvus]GEN10212.1 hypothetical protein MFU01_52490 [Myxococcus fulvus]SEU35043.1 hypothetical protein SAMN05443572_110186 [Myxococcus fulvus]